MVAEVTRAVRHGVGDVRIYCNGVLVFIARGDGMQIRMSDSGGDLTTSKCSRQ